MIPSIFSSPIPIADHQIKQAQAQGQSMPQTGGSSSQAQQSQSSSSKVVDSTAERTQTISAEMNLPVNAETGQYAHQGPYGPTTVEGTSMAFLFGDPRERYGSGVGGYDRSISAFSSSHQQQPFQSEYQQHHESVATSQQQMYLNSPEFQQSRHSQPPSTDFSYTDSQPQDNTQRSHSHGGS